MFERCYSAVKRARRGFVFAAVPAVLVALFVGNAAAQGTKTIRIGVLDNPVIFPVLVAQEKGYFEKVGLQPQITYFDSGPAIGQALSGGSIDVGFSGGALPLFASRGAGTAVVVTSLEEDSVKVIAKQGISAVKDLKGQPVAFTAGTSTQVVLYYALKAAGLTINDVQMVNTPPAGSVNALVAGKVAAAVVFPPFSVQALKALQGSTVIASGKQFSPNTDFFNGYLANNKLLSADRDTVVRFVAAMILANAAITADYAGASAGAYKSRFTKLDRLTYDEVLGGFAFKSNDWWRDVMTSGQIYDRADRLLNGFKEIGVVDNPASSKKWFDASVYADALKLVQSLR